MITAALFLFAGAALAPSASTRYLTHEEIRRIEATLCTPTTCGDRTYGGCSSDLCAQVSQRLTLSPTAEDQDLYKRECVSEHCAITDQPDSLLDPSGTGTLADALAHWSELSNRPMDCMAPGLVKFNEFFLPNEIAPSFDETVRRASCGLDSRQDQIRETAQARNAVRCELLRASRGQDCPEETLPCGADAIDLDPWLYAQRVLCPGAQRDSWAICSAVPTGVATQAKSLGVVCPPPPLVTRENNDCDFDSLPAPDALTYSNVLGSGAHVVIQTVSHPPHLQAGQLWLPGAHGVASPSRGGWPVSTSATYGWQSSETAMTDALYVVLSADDDEQLLLERFSIANPSVAQSPVRLTSWRLEDLRPQGCSWDALTACNSEFAWFQYELVASDPLAKPLDGRPTVTLTFPGDITESRRRCYESSQGAFCVEHRGISQVPPIRASRLTAWRIFEGSPLLDQGTVDERREALYGYFQARATPISGGMRVGVLDVLASGGSVEAAVVAVSGEPSAVLKRGTNGAFTLSRPGPIVERYLKSLSDTLSYDASTSISNAKRIGQLAMQLAPAMLATDPLLGPNRGHEGCAVSPAGPLCWLNQNLDVAPLIRSDIESIGDLSLLTSAYAVGESGVSSPQWGDAQSALERLSATGAPANSLVGVVNTQSRLAVLLTETRTDNGCTGHFHFVALDSGTPNQSTRFRVTAPSAASCANDVVDRVRMLIDRNLLDQLLDNQLMRGKNLPVVELHNIDAKGEFLIMALPNDNTTHGAFVSLSRAGLKSQPLDWLKAQSSYTKPLKTASDRMRFAECFLNSCSQTGTPRKPIAYFTN